MKKISGRAKLNRYKFSKKECYLLLEYWKPLKSGRNGKENS